MVLFTKAAAYHIIEYLKNRGKGVGIRLSVNTTGCSGLMYVVEPVDTPEAHDTVFYMHGATIFVDQKTIQYVDGVEIDYVKKGLNEGFEFKNPNVKSVCGCGESFTV